MSWAGPPTEAGASARGLQVAPSTGMWLPTFEAGAMARPRNPEAEEQAVAQLSMSLELRGAGERTQATPPLYLVVIHHAEGVLVACNEVVAVLAQVWGGDDSGLQGQGCPQGTSPPPQGEVPLGSPLGTRPHPCACPHPLGS